MGGAHLQTTGLAAVALLLKAIVHKPGEDGLFCLHGLFDQSQIVAKEACAVIIFHQRSIILRSLIS